MVCSRPTPYHSLNALTTCGTSLYVYNKIDSVSLDFLGKLAREPNTVVMSCELDLGIQDVVERCWQELQLMRIYTKRLVHTTTTYQSCLPIPMTSHQDSDCTQKRRRSGLQRGPYRP